MGDYKIFLLRDVYLICFGFVGNEVVLVFVLFL